MLTDPEHQPLTQPTVVRSDQVASTFGWDTVFAIRIRDVNTAIRNASPAPYPAVFAHPYQSSTLGAVPFRGSFGPWQMCSGGSGDIVRFRVPLTTLEFDIPDEHGKPVTTALGPAQAVIEVRLSFLPHEGGEQRKVDGKLHKLTVASRAHDPQQVPVTLAALEFGLDPHDETIVIAARSALTQWFDENLHDFTHIFSLVDIDRKADRGQFEWLLPTYTSYAYADNPASPDDSILAILCMTQNRSPDGLFPEVSEYAIPPGARSGFLISKARLLEELMLPTMSFMFEGAKPGDFVVSDSRDEIRLASSMLPVKAVKGRDGKAYPTELHAFYLKVDGEHISIEATTKVVISPDIYALCSSRSKYRLQLKNRADGKQIIDYVAEGDPVTHYSYSEELATQLAKGALAPIGVLIGFAITVLTEGAGTMVGLMIAALLIGASEGTPDLIASIGQTSAPSLDMLVLNTTDPIQWSGSNDFKLTWVGINDSLQLAGDPGFSS
ncbi:TULIP family P47-like protein [Sedimenticola hydrogenitrophicus]|uniref:TULIP family P47-like protein n=1 Tax=Sedimenticola hydrogenitrophicus TaxID=2967975 RepID=UPI0023B155F1|nr:TULIP family P47-like protein [Sedimenticola hydrogenitrophicus]